MFSKGIRGLIESNWAQKYSSTNEHTVELLTSVVLEALLLIQSEAFKISAKDGSLSKFPQYLSLALESFVLLVFSVTEFFSSL